MTENIRTGMDASLPENDSEGPGGGGESEISAEPFDAVAAAAEVSAALEAARTQQASSANRYIELLESEVTELGALLEAKEVALRETRARVEQVREEVDQARARLQRESAQELGRRTERVLLAFVEVLDELNRALESAGGDDAGSPLYTGLALVRRRFVATLESFGVRPLEAMGQPFDPAVHEAVRTAAVTDPGQEGLVLAVARAGWMVDGDRLLRPATVVVGRRR